MPSKWPSTVASAKTQNAAETKSQQATQRRSEAAVQRSNGFDGLERCLSMDECQHSFYCVNSE